MNNLTQVKAPKILPWLAHKAGIDDRRALSLWHAALRQAAGEHAPETSAYWQAALVRLRELIVAESRREDEASFGWRPWSRTVANYCAIRSEALDDIAQAQIRTWRVLGQNFHLPLAR